MKVIQIYYPNDGAFNCWEPLFEAEMNRLKLTPAERKVVTKIALPESMMPRKRKGEKWKR
jgi:hypothetical protein